MAEENEEQQEEKPSGGPGWLVALLMGIAGLGAGFGGSVVMMPNMVAQAPAEPAEEAEDEPADQAFAERVETLDPFVVNVSGEGYPRYLKLQIALEMDSSASRMVLKDRIPQVRDLTILLLSNKRLSDVTGFEGKALLKDDLRERINTLMPTGTVKNVMFTEFVVQ